jgi:hypothetical protein
LSPRSNSDDLGLSPEFLYEFIDRAHDDAALSLAGHLHALDLESRRHVDPQVGEVHSLDRLLLGLDDVLNIGEARRVQAEVTSEDSWEGHSDFLEAEIYFAGDFGGGVICGKFYLGAEGG